MDVEEDMDNGAPAAPGDKGSKKRFEVKKV